MKDPQAVRRGRNNKSRSKDVERAVARMVGGWRLPDTGDVLSDVHTETGVFEVKSRKQATPKLISEAWAQADTAASITGKIPHVVLAYTPGQGHKREYWLVMKLEGDEDEATEG